MMKRNLYAKATYVVISLATIVSGVFAIDVIFDSSLDTYFSGFENNYLELHFNQGSNDFVGSIFLQGTESLSTGEHMAIAGDAETFDCHKRVKGLYYNPQRGNSLWPLDTGSLTTLRQMNNSYDNITITGGLFTDCDGKTDEEIYGQVTHTLGVAEYRIVAGVMFQDNTYIQDFDDSFKYFESSGLANGKLFDSWGGVTEIFIPDGTVSSFSIPMLKNADLNSLVKSDSVVVSGLTTGDSVIASVNNGKIFINNVDAGITGYVKNGDSIQVELRSANTYNAVTTSVLTMGTRSATFYVTTKDENYSATCELSLSEKMRVLSIFDLLKDAYDDDPYKEESFLYTLKSMLEDRVDTEDECGPYQYLLDITEAYLLDEMENNNEDDNIYTAPNCKQYRIDYNNNRQAYYSEDFVTIHFFVSTEAIENYIDEYNLGDHECGYEEENDPDQRDRRVAPNGKVYEIRKAARGYTSDDFIYAKSFDSLETIRKYIDMNNPKIAVWDHDIDEDFEIETYIAPNGKEYKIQKVFVREDDEDITKYMSYKFIYVKYFDSIDEIKAYIDQNNPA